MPTQLLVGRPELEHRALCAEPGWDPTKVGGTVPARQPGWAGAQASMGAGEGPRREGPRRFQVQRQGWGRAQEPPVRRP